MTSFNILFIMNNYRKIIDFFSISFLVAETPAETTAKSDTENFNLIIT